MSHYHLEIVMPPVVNVEEAVKQIMAKFDEQGVNEDGDPIRNGFWDFWVIGGRFAGKKLECGLDPEKKEAFFAELTNRKVTVSNFQSGKKRLYPESQIPMVDALWNEYFPDSPVKVCPFFAHFNDQYKHSDGFPDFMPVKDTPKQLSAERVIIAGPHWDDEKAGVLQATYMVQESFWNGVTFVAAKWDGLLTSAIDEYVSKQRNKTQDYVSKFIPQDDWLVVTVDYHS